MIQSNVIKVCASTLLAFTLVAGASTPERADIVAAPSSTNPLTETPSTAIPAPGVPPATTATPVPTVASVTAAPAPAVPSNATAGEDLTLPVGRSRMIESPWPAKHVTVGDPKVADIIVLSPTQVLVSGKAIGSTSVIIWNSEDVARSYQIQVEVGSDVAGLGTELRRLFPDAGLEVRQSNGLVIVTGLLGVAEEAERLHRFLEASGIKYVDMTRLPGVQQVQIKVTVAEADRVAIRTLGINAFTTGGTAFGGSTVGSDAGGPINPISIGTAAGTAASGNTAAQFLANTGVSPAVTLFGGIPHASLEGFVQALAENQYLRVLAEPNLIALSGQEASFLAGGEFPIPVVQGAGASSSGTSITVDYKEFGVRLRFKPTVMGDGIIRLHVAPEVSELTTGTGSVQIQGFNIPGLLTRKAETTIDLGSGQTFAMAGLISESIDARSSRVPGLGDLPVLGALFRSVRYQHGDTELLLIVTASLVEPLSVANRPPVPGFTHAQPNDWEVYALGRIEGAAPAKISESDEHWLHDAGLSRLRGPGAWASYDTRAGTATSDATTRPSDH